MKKNIFKILCAALLISGLAASFQVDAVNVKFSCQNGVCASISDDLPDGSTGIDPNKTVNLSFSVYRQNDADSPPSCVDGRRLFHAVRHNIDGSAANWEYFRAGEGMNIEYSFSSGVGQQRNRYSGVFYCWTASQGVFKGNVDSVLGTLNVQNPKQAWLTPEFNLNTRVAQKLPVSETKKPETKTTEKKISWNFPNPLQAENLNDLIEIIMKWLRVIVLPIAVIVIVASGIVMMYAGADAGKFASAKKALLWAMVGLAVILIGEGFTKLIESIIELKDR